jgi:hypothetical protein
MFYARTTAEAFIGPLIGTVLGTMACIGDYDLRYNRAAASFAVSCPTSIQGLGWVEASALSAVCGAKLGVPPESAVSRGPSIAREWRIENDDGDVTLISTAPNPDSTRLTPADSAPGNLEIVELTPYGRTRVLHAADRRGGRVDMEVRVPSDLAAVIHVRTRGRFTRVGTSLAEIRVDERP